MNKNLFYTIRIKTPQFIQLAIMSITVISLCLGIGILAIPIFLFIFLYRIIPDYVLVPIKIAVVISIIMFWLSPLIYNVLSYVPELKNINIAFFSLKEIIAAGFIYVFIFNINIRELYDQYNRKSERQITNKQDKFIIQLNKIPIIYYHLNKACNKFLLIILYFTIPLGVVWLQHQISLTNKELEKLFLSYLNAFYFLTLPITLFAMSQQNRKKK